MATITQELTTVRFNRQQYARDFKVAHHSYERQQYRNFKLALDNQVKPVIDWVSLHGINGIDQKITVLVSPQPMANAYKRCYTMVGVAHAKWTYNRVQKLGQQKSESLFSEYWRKLMSLFFETDGGTRIKQVTETTREVIMNILAGNQDLPTSQRADDLVNKLSDKDFNRDRALRIARTESTTAANKGAFLGGESSDYETGKIWIPVLDANTRPDHAAMDGQPAIGMDELFMVGNSEMMYPGDISAPANEVINCRCSLAVVPLVGSNGLPILKVA
jgi:uncharacterized protein with gpF-like domain